MERICFVLQVRPERLEEYKDRHRSVWPEMQQALRETGWGNYSLFLRSDGLLVGYVETEDFPRALSGMAKREVNARWQREMSEFFMHSPGLPPDRAITPLEEVFHLDPPVAQNAATADESRASSRDT
jgi:L-rhamnose mutarotase